MYRGTKAYLFKDHTVVLNKIDIKNAKEGDFREIMLYLPYEFIKRTAVEIEFFEEGE